MLRIKDVAKLNPPTLLPKLDEIEFFPMEAIGVDGGLTIGQRKAVSQASGYSQIKNGDVCFAKVTPCFENGKSAIVDNLISTAALATTEITVLRPNKKINLHFLHYRIKGLDFAVGGANEMKGAGGLKRVPERFAADFVFELPPLPDQLAIADYLDRQTALIDQRLATLAEKKTLLAELRKATIHEAVTKGAIWNAETGQVENLPTGWVMLRIKDIANLRSGEFIAAERIEPTGNYPVYGGNGLRGYTDRFTHSGTFSLIGRQGALCGNVNYASEKFWATEHAVVVLPKWKIDVRWFGEMLRSMNLNQYATASAQPGLSVEVIVNKFIPYPTFDEQKTIAAHLDQQTQQFDAQLATLDEQAKILKELRKAIIHEAVTGKIDLSGVESGKEI